MEAPKIDERQIHLLTERYFKQGLGMHNFIASEMNAAGLSDYETWQVSMNVFMKLGVVIWLESARRAGLNTEQSVALTIMQATKLAKTVTGMEPGKFEVLTEEVIAKIVEDFKPKGG